MAQEKVYLRVAVTVDPKTWAEEFGIDEDEVQEDVANWARTHLNDSYVGTDLSVEFKVTG